MTLEPDTSDSVFTRIRNTVAAITEVTNFSRNAPERGIVRAFADEQRDREHELLHVQLSARVDYAGKEITEDDLEDLGLDPSKVDLELLNSYQEDQDLDELAVRNSVVRDPGSFATGTVTFQVTSDTARIPEGTVVTTDPDADGDAIRFQTTEEVTPASNASSVDAPIEAVERGTAGNVGSGTITNIPSPPPQVSGDPPVNNSSATTDGESRETNAELRQRTKLAIVGSAGGGTTEGVIGGLVERFDGLDRADVDVDEDFSNTEFDVIVDGGPSDSDLNDAIDELQPVTIAGTLVRPTEITIDVSTTVSGSGVDTGRVEDRVRSLIENLGIGEDVIRDQLIAAIMTADDGVSAIDSLSTDANGSSFSGDKAIGAQETAEAGSISVNVS